MPYQSAKSGEKTRFNERRCLSKFIPVHASPFFRLNILSKAFVFSLEPRLEPK
jgi:hypothetical protein